MKTLTPLQGIRKKCVECMNGNFKEIDLCPTTDCSLYPFRMQKGSKGLLKAIKSKCIDCGEGTIFAVKKCKFPDCPLFLYRLGKNPNRKGIGNYNPTKLKKRV